MDGLLWKVPLGSIFGYFILLLVKQLDRLLYHPLREYPGPRLAAMTVWYKAYYEVVKGGDMLEQLEKLHHIYGPIVRIAPNELHFSDPLAFADIYAPGSKFTKDPTLYTAFGEDESSFGYVDPEQSKARRDVLNPLFSRRAILKLENVIQEKVDKFIARVILAKDKPVNMSRAFRSLTLDIITSYCFAKSSDTLEAAGFSHPLLVTMEVTPLLTWIFKYFPSVRFTLPRVPEWLALHLSPHSKGYIDLRRGIASQIDHILNDPGSLEYADREIIYHHLLMPQKNHPVPSRKSLEEEATNLIFAGADTVGNTIALGTFFVLNDKTVLTKLITELTRAWPDKYTPLGYEALEKLPYLAAVIKESLRMSHGAVTPLPRVVGPTSAIIVGKHIPAGTIVSIGSTFVHWDSKLFHEPRKFSPERWLQPNPRVLENYLVPFSRGPRSCLGINLAKCELCLIFANVFRKLEMESYNTTEDDFNFKAYFLPHYQGRFLYARVQERCDDLGS